MNRDTPGYTVSADGRVFSVESNWRGYGVRELAQHPNSHGYPSIRANVEGKRKRLLVHTMVAYQFLPERPSPAHEVRHLNGDKTDNRVENLAWGTRKENADDRQRHGRTSRGANHSSAIRTSNQAEGTRAYHRSKKEARTVAAATGETA